MGVKVTTEGRVQIVTLERPEARNAVDPAHARALYAAMRAFHADPELDICVLTGAGGTFCAGFDLKAAASGEGSAWLDELDIPSSWKDPLAEPLPGPMGPTRLMLRKPVIAAIEGYAVAGGLELALWCDMRVAAEDAKFGVFCRRWGVPLIDGGTIRLPLAVGQSRANDMVLTGREVGAEEAAAMGLVNRLAPKGGALEAALALAHDLTRFPQGTMRADFLSARMPPEELAARLKREWVSAEMLDREGLLGAARFTSGKGRGGDQSDI